MDELRAVSRFVYVTNEYSWP